MNMIGSFFVPMQPPLPGMKDKFPPIQPWRRRPGRAGYDHRHVGGPLLKEDGIARQDYLLDRL
eukprot:7909713-Alexandrium_andersonii.AAC.1